REFLPDERWSLFFEEYRHVVETGESRKFESVTYEGPYGNQHLSVALDISAARFGDGFIATWRDVTERKKREELLLERERFIAHVASVTPGIIFVYDLVERRILYVNDQVTSFTGFTPEQILEFGPSVHEAL